MSEEQQGLNLTGTEFEGKRIEDKVKVQATFLIIGSERILAFILNKMGNHWKILSRGTDII